MRRAALSYVILSITLVVASAPAVAASADICGSLITSDVTLAENLTCDIHIAASGVTVDLNGYEILGVVQVGRSDNQSIRDVTIRNGTITALPRAILLNDTILSLLENLVVAGDVDFLPLSSGNTLRDSVVHGQVGMWDAWGHAVVGNTVHGRIASDVGHHLIKENIVEGYVWLLDDFAAGGNNTVVGNTIIGGGVEIIAGSNSKIVNNKINGAEIGIDLRSDSWHQQYPTTNNVIRSNRITRSRIGIRIGSVEGPEPEVDSLAGTVVEDNHIQHSGAAGILAVPTVPTEGSRISGNTIQRTGHDPGDVTNRSGAVVKDGIHVEAESDFAAGFTLANNTVIRTAGLGVYAPGVVDGGGNHVRASGDRRQCIGVSC